MDEKNSGIKVYTPAQVAEVLNVRENTVRSWTRSGKIQSFKISNRVFISKAVLDALLSGNSEGVAN